VNQPDCFGSFGNPGPAGGVGIIGGCRPLRSGSLPTEPWPDAICYQKVMPGSTAGLPDAPAPLSRIS
jgi:hypothetical protein